MLVTKLCNYLNKLWYLKISFLFSILIYSIITLYSEDVPEECFPEHLQKYLVDAEYDVATNDSLNALKERILKINSMSEVRNMDYGPLTSDTPLVVVTVRQDLSRLRHLVAALAQVSGIDEMLLVFSHSYAHPTVDGLIREIDFCMVLQIYYPFSVQLHPNAFPGHEHNLTRDALQAERKHHWWWTANYVFEQVDAKIFPSGETHKEVVIFIDECSYILPDFTFMLAISKYSMSYFPDLELLSFGRPPAADLEYDVLTVETWRAPHGSGLAMFRSTWKKIRALGRYYCEYDDTSWSGSLVEVLSRLGGGRARALAVQAPRVRSTAATSVSSLASLCSSIPHRLLYPREVRAVVVYNRDGELMTPPADTPPHGNGGWGDPRDHQLCYSILNGTDSI